MDHGGVTRDKTSILLSKRVKIIDKVHLESNRLEKRLEKVKTRREREKRNLY